jgi:hypothetical protein
MTIDTHLLHLAQTLHFQCSHSVTHVCVCVCSGIPRGGGGGVNPLPPPKKFQSFDKAAIDYKLSRKCLVFLFHHPN